MEYYIRNELPFVLETIEKSKGKKLNQIEKSFIFGMKYASNESSFMLVPGEEITIKNIAYYVRSKLATDENHFALNVDSRLGKFNPKDVVNTIIGLIYGDVKSWKKSIRQESNARPVECVADLKQKLLDILLDLLRQQNYHPGSDSGIDTMDEIIDVDYKDLANIKGTIKCMLCSKPYSVFCKQSKSSFSWIISNFKRHFQKCTKNVAAADTNSSHSSALVALTIEPISSTNEEAEFTKYSKVLRSQLMIQGVKMVNSTSRNGEITKICVIDSGDEINVCEMKADGNCLFFAISHQLKSVRSGSEAHKINMTELRSDCVEYMKNNLEKYERYIRDRIQEKFPGKSKVTLEDCGTFLDEHLPKNSSWCGSETLIALTDMLKINIVVFTEKGCVYFATKFEPKYDRTIMIAFRIANPLNVDISNANRNHYDSVVKVETDTITKLVHDLVTKYLKSSALKASDSVIIVD